MATYLNFHQLDKAPFEGPDGERFVLATESLRRAYAEIRRGMEEGAPRICLAGPKGIGKSSLAKALPKLLGDSAQTALVRDPSKPWNELRTTITRQLGLPAALSRDSLLTRRNEGYQLLIVIDRAEEIPTESLDQLDVLLGYRGDDGRQLVHCVLLANLEGAARGEEIPLVWWLDRLQTTQLRYSPIPVAGIRTYVDKHLKKAGWEGSDLFTEAAAVAIHRYTGGVPGAVSSVCEELLRQAAERGLHEIGPDLVAEVCDAAGVAEQGPEPEPEAEPEGAGRSTTDFASAVGAFGTTRPVTTSPAASSDFFASDETPRGSSPYLDEPEEEEPIEDDGWLPGDGLRARLVAVGVAAAALLALGVGGLLFFAGGDDTTSASAPADPAPVVQRRQPPPPRPEGLTPDTTAPSLSEAESFFGTPGGDELAGRTLEEVFSIGPEADEGTPAYEPWTWQRPSAPPSRGVVRRTKPPAPTAAPDAAAMPPAAPSADATPVAQPNRPPRAAKGRSTMSSGTVKMNNGTRAAGTSAEPANARLSPKK